MRGVDISLAGGWIEVASITASTTSVRGGRTCFTARAKTGGWPAWCAAYLVAEQAGTNLPV